MGQREAETDRQTVRERESARAREKREKRGERKRGEKGGLEREEGGCPPEVETDRGTNRRAKTGDGKGAWEEMKRVAHQRSRP